MNTEELKTASRHLAKLFACFRQQAQADVDMQMRGYLDAVKNAELVDFEMAVGRFQRGEVPGFDAAFCPSSAQVSIETRVCNRYRMTAERKAKGEPRVVPLLLPNHFQNRLKQSVEQA